MWFRQNVRLGVLNFIDTFFCFSKYYIDEINQTNKQGYIHTISRPIKLET